MRSLLKIPKTMMMLKDYDAVQIFFFDQKSSPGERK